MPQRTALIVAVAGACLLGCAPSKPPAQSGLPDLREVDKRGDEAEKAVDAIDQPVDETCRQRLTRLGLRPEQIGLTSDQVDTAPPSCKR